MAASRSSAHRACRRWGRRVFGRPRPLHIRRRRRGAHRRRGGRSPAGLPVQPRRQRHGGAAAQRRAPAVARLARHAGGRRNRDARGRGLRVRSGCAGGVASADGHPRWRRADGSVHHEPRRFACADGRARGAAAGGAELPARAAGRRRARRDRRLRGSGGRRGGQRRASRRGAALAPPRGPAAARVRADALSRQRRARRVHRARLHPRRARRRRRRRAQRRRRRPRRLRSGGVHAAVAAASLDLSDPQCSSVCFAAAFPNYLSGAGYMWFSQDCIDYQGGHGCIYNTAASSSGWGCRLCNTQPGTDGGYEYGECPPCVERHYASPPPPAPPTSPPPVPPGWSFAEYWANPVLLHLNISLALSALPDGAESLCVSSRPPPSPTAPASRRSRAGSASISSRRSHRRSRCRSTPTTTCSPPSTSPSASPPTSEGATSPPPPSPSPTTCHSGSSTRRRPTRRTRPSRGSRLGRRRRVLFQRVGWGLGEEEGVHLRAVGQLGDGVVAIRRGRVGDGVRRRDGRQPEHAAVRRQPRRVWPRCARGSHPSSSRCRSEGR